MRLFFGLDLPAHSKLEIDEWRKSNYSLLGPGVPAANFHITLAFMGSCTARQAERLAEGAQAISVPAINLLLDDVGFWPKNGILWLGSQQPCAELHALARSCQRLTRSLQLDQSGKRFHPHVTLWRRQHSPPPPPVSTPQIYAQIDEFCLFESVIHKGRVRYQIVERFSQGAM